MVICPSCGAENTPDAKFCEECGAQMQDSEAAEAAATGRQGTLADGDVIDERIRVDATLEAGKISRYRATVLEGENEVLVLEGPENDTEFLEKQQKRLADVECEGLWRPHESFSWQNRCYLVGAYPGQTLQQKVEQDGPLEPEQVTELAEKLAESLGAIHQAHLLHVAIAPGHIWLTDDTFLLDPFSRLSAKGVVGDNEVTAGFSGPECYGMQGGQIDERSDIFSLGAVMHYALSGKRTDLESRETFFNFPRPEGPAGLVKVVMKAVAKNPEQRFANTEAFLEGLRDPDSLTTATAPAAAAAAAPEPTPAPTPVAVGAAASSSAAARPTPATSSSADPATEGLGTAIVDYQVAMQSDVGCVRSVNQDACLELRFASVEKSCPHDGHLVVVVDGMGGEAEGDKAASLALRAIAQEVIGMTLSLRNSRHTTPLLPHDRPGKNKLILKRALEVANRTIHDYAELKPSERRGMGCTVTAALLDGDSAVFGHVGDTRAYLFRNDLEKITTDHSLVGRLVEMGQMTAEEARNSPQRSIIYRAMGTNPEVEVDVYERQLQAGDYLMMSSDGVWEYFEHEELNAIFQERLTPEELCRRLVRICLDRGADDNATLAVVKALGPA